MTETTASMLDAKEPGYTGQTFLVGEQIYLRRIEKEDARLTVSWRESRFPLAPAITESWIVDESWQGGQAYYAIVRKSDDRIVGTLLVYSATLGPFLNIYVDPFYGDMAGEWKADVIRLAVPWLIDEQHRIRAYIEVGGNETAAIAALVAIGAWEAARSPDLLCRDGERVDLVRFEYLNRQWMERLGDPREIPLERTGSGRIRPVPAKGTFFDDPPKNALAIGKRIYLKPIEKEDAEAMARMARRETETFYGHSRMINSGTQQVIRRLDAFKERWPTDVGFAVCLRADGRTIGEVAVIDIDYLNRFGETASWIYDPDFRGDGYGSEAKHLLLEYAFDSLGLLAVESFVTLENTRSAAALRGQGYREVGILHWTSARNGGFGGNVIFNLTADEWRALPREKGGGE